MDFEKSKDSLTFTSVLALNEFCQDVHHHYSEEDDYKDRLDRALLDIRQIVDRIYAIPPPVAIRGAELLSIWKKKKLKIGGGGDQRPGHARNHPKRWDALHLATAEHISAKRVYAWDDDWKTLEFTILGCQIISPAECPQLHIEELLEDRLQPAEEEE